MIKMKNLKMKSISLILSLLLCTGCMHHFACYSPKQERLNAIRHLGIGTILVESSSETLSGKRKNAGLSFPHISSQGGDDGMMLVILLAAVIVAILVVKTYEHIKSDELDKKYFDIRSDLFSSSVKKKFDSCLLSNLTSGLEKNKIKLHSLGIENDQYKNLEEVAADVKRTHPTLDAVMLLPFSYEVSLHQKKFNPRITAQLCIFNLKGKISLLEKSKVTFSPEEIESRTDVQYEANQCALIKSDLCHVATLLSKKIVNKVFPEIKSDP